ncbi:AAA family ATPase [Kribbella sp. VKM Ac-2568]|uniref:AAA family ATPase n=1 Tax=Kribbella sp. VKM Ac-2568 TaxID=2512219 RepID=UPI0010EE05A1|nr:AAA family ATPase [Kribbella sp. VKM Ac-2568]TCM51743.1 putative kinase [Kribbella sp. VKM Ac-2568]
MEVPLTALLIPPDARQDPGITELRYPADSVVVLAGIPGAGKSTLLRRLFPESAAVRVLDSERIRDRWKPVLGPIPYSVWRPLMHLTYYARVLRAIRGGGPLVVHECATRPWARQLIGRCARLSGLAVHLIMLDVPADVARLGQQSRARVVRPRSMAVHSRRWPELLDLAADDPGQVVPGAASAVILDRDQADLLRKITFTPRPDH